MITIRYFNRKGQFLNSNNNLNILDAVVPVITFINPSPKTDGSPEFTWRSSEQATFECSLDRGPYEDCGSGMNGRWSKDNVRDGRHILSVRGKDTVENLGRTTSHSWTVGKMSNLNGISADSNISSHDLTFHLYS